MDDDEKPSDEDAILPEWARRPPPPEARPARPLAPSRPSGAEPAVYSPLPMTEGARYRRGLLIHQLLQLLPEVPADQRAGAADRFLARPTHGLDAERRRSYAAEAMAVLEHPAFADLFGPGSKAEVPITARIGNTVLSGQVDRLLVAANRVTVLDYKTNRPPPKTVEAVDRVYLEQMAAYRAALRVIYRDRPVVCVLGWTDGPVLMRLPDDVLDRHAPDAQPVP